MSRFSRVCCGMPAAAASTDLTIHLICVMPAVSVLSFNEWAGSAARSVAGCLAVESRHR
jgi:hypothetical protein